MKEDIDMPKFTPSPSKGAARLTEITQLLTFIEDYADIKHFFDKNGSRSIYAKFRDANSRERILHQVVHYFISLHIP